MRQSATKTPPEKCPICKEGLCDPRLLPCAHSFCLQCLVEYCKDKEPRDEVPCPVCRTEFQIPKNGVAGLLIRTYCKDSEVRELCEACSTDDSNTPATVYCVDCGQKLCSRCSIPHKKWKGGPHDVRSLDEVPSLDGGGGRYCEEHHERLRMYCFTCKESVCSMCCHETHKEHKFERIEAVRERSARSIDDEISPITSRIESFHGATAQVEAEHSKLLDNIKEIENEVKAGSSQIRQLLDKQENELLQSIEELKLGAVKAAKSHTDEMQLALTEMDSFRTSSLELKSTNSPNEIVQGAEEVRVEVFF